MPGGSGSTAGLIAAHGTGPKHRWTLDKLRKGAGPDADPSEIDVPAVKVKAETRDLSAESGDVAYTGYGFQPTGLIILQASSTWSIGASDPAKGMFCYYKTTTDPWHGVCTSHIIRHHWDAATSQVAIVKSYDADGFTLTWTKAGSPTGTANLIVFAFK